MSINRVGYVLVLLSLFLLVESQDSEDSDLDDPKSEGEDFDSSKCFGIMFDCGSSSTKLAIYQWDCKDVNITNNVQITKIGKQMKKKPGISDFNQDLDGLNHYLSELIDKAKQIVPQEKWRETPIMLGATAGMRLLPKEDKEEIMNVARKILRDSGFLFYSDHWCRILTGQEEGAAMWLSTNYLLNNIWPEKVEEQTVSIIELGGASVQIAFSYQVSCQVPNQFVNINIPRYNDYDVYSSSYLGYGNDEARNKVLEMSKKSMYSNIFSPCYPKGYTGRWEKYPQYFIIGQGLPIRCLQLISDLLSKLDNPATIQSEEEECNPDQKILAPIDQQIYVFGAIRYAANVFQYDEYFTPGELQLDAIEFCQQSWEQIQYQHSRSQYAHQLCFLTLYTSSLLIDGYKIPPQTKVFAPFFIKNVFPNWGLGGIFYNMVQTKCERDYVCYLIRGFFNQQLHLDIWQEIMLKKQKYDSQSDNNDF